MKHFYFIEDETGEEFLVGAKNYAEAFIIATDVADSIANEYSIHPIFRSSANLIIMITQSIKYF